MHLQNKVWLYFGAQTGDWYSFSYQPAFARNNYSGGGITEAGKDLFEPLEEYLAKYEWRAGGNKVEIIKAAFGDMSGAAGAACYAKELHEAAK